MNLNDFVKNFSEQFDETDPSTITPATKFRSLDEWSSLVALSIIAMIDEAYEVKVKGDDIRNSETVEDLFNLVQSRLGR